MPKISDKTRNKILFLGILFLVGNFSLGSLYDWHPTMEINLLGIIFAGSVMLKTIDTAEEHWNEKTTLIIGLLVVYLMIFLRLKALL